MRDRQTGRQRNRETERQTGRPDRQRDRQTRQADQTDRKAGRQAGRQASRQDRQAGRQAGSQTDLSTETLPGASHSRSGLSVLLKRARIASYVVKYLRRTVNTPVRFVCRLCMQMIYANTCDTYMLCVSS